MVNVTFDYIKSKFSGARKGLRKARKGLRKVRKVTQYLIVIAFLSRVTEVFEISYAINKSSF